MYPRRCRTERWRGGAECAGARVEGMDTGAGRVGMTARESGEERSGAVGRARSSEREPRGAGGSGQSEPMGGRDDGASARAERNCQRHCCAVSRPVVTHSHGSRGPLFSSCLFPRPPTTRIRRRGSHPPPTLYAPTLPPLPPPPPSPPPLPFLPLLRIVRAPLVSASPCAPRRRLDHERYTRSVRC